MATVQEIVTERIISALESGTVPWRKPWSASSGGRAINYTSRRPYHGVNAILLEPGEYLTFKAIQTEGAHLRKGSKAHLVVFWKPSSYTRANEDGAEEEHASLILRYYNVYNVTDCDGLKPKGAPLARPESIEAAEAILHGYTGPSIAECAQDKAYYSPSTDRIVLPTRGQFHKLEHFYSTAFHECIHSTGHPSRLDRFNLAAGSSIFGSASYAKEELIAEIGAAMLCTQCAIDQTTFPQSANYIANWLQALKNDARLIISAASKAQKAVDCMLGTSAQQQAAEAA